MPYLIDGHNLIPKIPGLNLQDADDEIALVQLLQKFGQQTGKQIEVYFDNAPPGYSGTRTYGNVKAIFVRSGRTADERIRQRLSQLKRGAKNWTVVSSDRQVQSEARSAGAQVIPSNIFALELTQNESVTPGNKELGRKLSDEEIETWLEIFNSPETSG